MSKLMITGASGFVGRHLCQAVGDCIKVVRHLQSDESAGSIVVPELDETVDWKEVIPSNVYCIIHLAGVAHNTSCDTYYIRRINVDGTLHLAKQAALLGVKRFVFVSSIGVNGANTQCTPFSIEANVDPQNTYARSKYDAEIGLKKIADETGLEVVIIRPTLVYGPNAPGNFGLLTKLVCKLPFLPFGSTSNRRDFIAVQNLSDLLITCANHPNAAGRTFLASDGETVSIKEFTNAIAKGLGRKTIQVPIPVSLMRLVGKITNRSIMIDQLYGNLEVDSSEIKELLGWAPPFTMEQAMATLCDTGNKNNDSCD